MKGSRMTPEIAERYRRKVEWWRANTPRLPPPLPYEVPSDSKVRISSEAHMGAHINERHFYVEGGGARTGLILLYWMAGVLGGGFLFLTVLRPMDVILLIPNWSMALLFGAIAYWAWRAEKRVTRKNTVVFERETGKIYVPVDEETPHVELDFYDQYFYVQTGQVDMNTHAGLWLYLPKVRLEDGRDVGDFPVRLAFVGTEDEAVEAWHFLVRYMDKDWPFDDNDFRYFDFMAEEKKRQGFKVEGIRRQPGERVFF